MLRTKIEKEWCEVRRPGRGKVEDWSWCVTFYDSHEWEDPLMDRHWYSTEAAAKMNAALFEDGKFKYGEHGEVVFDKIFEDVEVTEDE